MKIALKTKFNRGMMKYLDISKQSQLLRYSPFHQVAILMKSINK